MEDILLLQGEEFLQWFGRLMLNILISFALLNAFIQYIWEHRKELKENWRKY
tara:strand:- start:178 stop:333 length:156 start_codon:yes stop_codon:yes gene_type:complete